MRPTLRAAWLTAGLALTSLLGIAPGEARAQNTYADAPFNQGSLFYRPSGRKPPQTTYSAPRIYRQAAPGYATQAPAPRGYYYPAPQTYAVRPRGLFRGRVYRGY